MASGSRHFYQSIAIVAAVGSGLALSSPALAQSTLPPPGGSAILPAPEPLFGGIKYGKLGMFH
jgi:hypothetical protein